ncbi:DUF6458 family protein [Streptomyces sanyensis]|uniref:DUF6458 family protein n=1 Tax=Streptomyces sanyensis TaxID=568869 RepID=UPI003D77D767
MGIGGCIILIAAGAILTFGTEWQVDGVNLDVVGIILMAVGLIGVATFTSIAKRRRVLMPQQGAVVEEHPDRHPR